MGVEPLSSTKRWSHSCAPASLPARSDTALTWDWRSDIVRSVFGLGKRTGHLRLPVILFGAQASKCQTNDLEVGNGSC